jgi:hypothetical protein
MILRKKHPKCSPTLFLSKFMLHLEQNMERNLNNELNRPNMWKTFVIFRALPRVHNHHLVQIRPIWSPWTIPTDFPRPTTDRFLSTKQGSWWVCFLQLWEKFWMPVLYLPPRGEPLVPVFNLPPRGEPLMPVFNLPPRGEPSPIGLNVDSCERVH